MVFGSKQIEITVGLLLLHLIRRKRHLPLKGKAAKDAATGRDKLLALRV